MYAAEINKMNKTMNSEAGTVADAGESVEEETIRIEDMTCLKFGVISIYQLKDIIARKHVSLKSSANHSESKPAET